jgi:hypothetical protein
MKYMLMMNAKRGKGDWEIGNWPQEALKAHIGFMMRFTNQLKESRWSVDVATSVPRRTRCRRRSSPLPCSDPTRVCPTTRVAG